jgi:FlaA1/EpsC-like NDP-sugar epimerase
MLLQDKSILITGGTGSLGKVLVRRLLSAELGTPRQVIVLSRDEAKQHDMRLEYMKLPATTTEEIIFSNFQRLLTFRVGDIRDFTTVALALQGVDVVFNAAALKQVPTCEYFPYEAVQTNITGAENIVRAIRALSLPVELVVGISTDKACKPVNVMGMTKALQERIIISGNLYCTKTRFVCVRYGNVLASRGSVVPLFLEQIRRGGPVTVTTSEMTRFLLSLNQAVDTVYTAVRHGKRGEIIIPRIPSANIMDLASGLIGDRPIKIETTGIRPGEKVHEILVSEEEGARTHPLEARYYVIQPMLPELQSNAAHGSALGREYSSRDDLLGLEEVRNLLQKHGLLDGVPQPQGELLR